MFEPVGGATVTIKSGYNVNSIGYTSPGEYSVIFSERLDNTHYIVMGMVESSIAAANTYGYILECVSRDATSFNMVAKRTTSATVVDVTLPGMLSVLVFGG
jgi:hypothetical protein